MGKVIGIAVMKLGAVIAGGKFFPGKRNANFGAFRKWK